MLENLVKDLVNQYAGSAVVNNPSIPNEQNESAISSITDGILGGLKQQAAGAGLNSIIGMLTKGGNVDAATSQNVQGSVIDSLMSKLGIGKGVASNIAAQIVPAALGALSHNTADKSNTNFDLSGILSSLTGGKTNGVDIAGLVDKGFGNGDGKLDMNDLTSALGNLGNLFGKKA
ncbi:hypothetical protein FACS189451_06140 [Bacteroidia bacterium]|nr:hypothetical protein FACS189451_06140 [Bacteroidia bacterium]